MTEQDSSFQAVFARQRETVRAVDWIMLVLAFVSVIVLTWATFGDVSPEILRWIIISDFVVCGIFLIEFLYRWREAGWPLNFPLRRWYEVLGMIPVADPALRGLRLLRVVRVIILLSRLGRAADRALGEEFVYRLVRRFSNIIIGVIKRPITIAVIGEVADVLKKGHYTQNVARALEQNHQTLVDTILDQIAADSRTSYLQRVPFYRDIARVSADTSLSVVLQILQDPRTDELVADILRENLDQIRESIRERDIQEPLLGRNREPQEDEASTAAYTP
ncbi:ion transporter [Algiphilus sp.]|uniref:ion transporter n=1 Tax=Algiphilus sp. TaxID=1872431 RepID=UPI001CA72883|nr:ion transporter [Algiphilus sp.]MBY8966030.1 ion transporter [Algiphilus acroporae]MCI5063382.1 ion transporter [Algiphilus sp.]MCI5102758.1 ion transporter [Algiphilus sp.]MCR9091640.1 ion transporter [Pseudomonadota bacterium]